MREDLLLGEWRNIKVVKSQESDFSKFEKEIARIWNGFKKTNPKATDEPKIRLNNYYIEGDTMIVGLSEGISFANVIYSNHIIKTKGLPEIASDTYEKRDNKFHARMPFANATSVAGIVVFDPDNSYDVGNPNVKTLLSVRAKRVVTNPGVLGIMVNGYVDVGEINDSLLLDNLYREAEEESMITRDEIVDTTFVGPSQSRGKSCDLVWVVRTNLSYESWKERWSKNVEKQSESSGVVPIRISDLQRIVDPEFVREILLEDGIISDELKLRLEAGVIELHPMLRSLYPIMLTRRMSYYLDRMKSEK